MLKVKELKEGKCTVIAKNEEIIKEFEGYYNSEFEIVYFCVPSYYKILGYTQSQEVSEK